MKYQIGEDNNVISIEIARDRMVGRIHQKRCAHKNVFIDPMRPYLECQDCGKDVNPIEWLSETIEFTQYLIRKGEEYKAAKAEYENKSKCKCRNCGKMTPIFR